MRRVFNCIKSEEANEERGKEGDRERDTQREREREREREGETEIIIFVKFDQGTKTNIVGT